MVRSTDNTVRGIQTEYMITLNKSTRDVFSLDSVRQTKRGQKSHFNGSGHAKHVGLWFELAVLDPIRFSAHMHIAFTVLRPKVGPTEVDGFWWLYSS